jgi:hypothetical protein
MLGRSPIGTWIVSAAESTRGTARTLSRTRSKNASRTGGGTRPAGSTRIAIAPRIESGIDVHELGEAAQQQPAGHRENDHDGDLHGE